MSTDTRILFALQNKAECVHLIVKNVSSVTGDADDIQILRTCRDAITIQKTRVGRQLTSSY